MVTGHRPKYLGNEYNLVGPYSDYIRKELQKIIEEYKPTKMISGMALGSDTIWAQLAIDNKIPFLAAIPFIGQEAHWPHMTKIRYCRLLEQASEVEVVSESATAEGSVGETMKARDRWMVDHADMVVAVLDKKRRWSGTAYTARYAKEKKVSVIYVDPDGWRP